MQLWQLDLVGGVPLADGRECKMVAPGKDPAGQLLAGVFEPPPAMPPGRQAVEFDVRVPPTGGLTLVPGKQQVSVNPGLADRTLTICADLRSIHLLLDRTCVILDS
jgi:hypothetical protein